MTMAHLLDRPIWTTLNSRHAALAEGGRLAKRYPADMSAFAGTGEETPESIAALGELAEPGGTLLLVQKDALAFPAGFEAITQATLVQMVADSAVAFADDERIRPLGPADAADMLELAQLTKPGPFSLRAQDFGPFWGIREEGRLVAMAGQRLGQEGFRELSGVCVHPDEQGQGLGRLMSLYGARKIQEAGDTAYLHAYATNAPAIRLYESIGFQLRETMNMAIIRREG